MIRINLLPVDKRRKERTPLPRLGLVVLDAAVFTVILFYAIFVFFQIGDREREIASLQSALTSLDPAVRKHADLTTYIRKLEGTVREIESTIGEEAKRHYWWQSMDALWDVIHQNPKIWIDEITVLDDRQAQSAARKHNPDFGGLPPFGVSIKCHASGRDIGPVTKFRKDLKRHAGLRKWFQEINWDVQWNVAEEEDFVEKYSLNFDINLIGRSEGGGPPGAVRR